MFLLSSEAKVGLFVLIGLVILGYMSFKVGQQNFGMKKGYTVDALFDNVAGLAKDAPVQIAGVDVGRVENIKLKDGKAQVTLRINPEVKLEKDVVATIKTHGIMGEKYVNISPGTKGEKTLTDGEQIKHVVQQADFEQVLSKIALIADDIKTLSSSLNKVLGGEDGKSSIGTILENMGQLTYNLNKLVMQNETKVGQAIEGIRDASREMEKTFASLSDISESIKKGEGTMGQLITDKGMAEKLNKTITSLHDVSEKLNQGKGTLGKLLNDEETVNNLNQSLTGINKYINKSEQMRTFIGYRGEYLFDKHNVKSYLDLRIQPKEDYFYQLGVVFDPRGRQTIKDFTTNGITTRTEEWDKSGLLFSAQIGKRYRDFVIRGGLLESTGGAGLDFLALNDRLKLTFEAFDFSEDRRAHLKALAEFRLFKYLYLTAGWDDPLNKGNRSPFVGFSLRFEDDDLKPLLTSVPIPK